MADEDPPYLAPLMDFHLPIDCLKMQQNQIVYYLQHSRLVFGS